MPPNAGRPSNVASANVGRPGLMSLDQAAASLGLSKNVLVDLARKKIVPAVTDGKTMMFKSSEVEAFREAWQGVGDMPLYDTE
jgi:hypothetical protein